MIQAAPDRPVFRGVGAGGEDVFCPGCEEGVLLENVSPEAVFDIKIQCASCGVVSDMPSLPSGRGLGGVLRVVRRDHQAAGTFVMDMDEVIVGERAIQKRARETGGELPEPEPAVMDIAGIERIVEDARSTFEPILRVVEPRSARSTVSKHRLVRLIHRLEENVSELRAGGDTVDVYSVISLQRATSAFRRWAQDPSGNRLMQESAQPEAFDHNTVLLEVATMFENTRLGAELVPPSGGRTADLILRLSASRSIEVDTKAPRAVQRPAEAVVSLVEPRRTIKRALRSSRGQFSRSGILAIAGDFWIDGIDAYAAAAAELLNLPLPDDASLEARRHYERLLGIVFASTGYDVDDRTYKTRLFLRWVPNPRYSGEIDLTLPPDLDGPFTIGFRSPLEASGRSRPSGGASGSETSPTFESEPFGLARFRMIGDREVHADGAIINKAPNGAPGRTVVFRFSVGYRPPVAVDFDAACEVGFTVVTVEPDGSLLADPNVGWISLHGVRFATA